MGQDIELSGRPSNLTDHPSNGLQDIRVQAQADEDIDVRDYLSLIADEKWRILGILLMALILAGAYLFITPLMYKANALLLVDNETALLDNPLQGNQINAGETQQENNGISQAVVRLIESRAVLGKVINDFGLDVDTTPVYFPLIGKAIARQYGSGGVQRELASPLFGMNQYAWGGEEIKIQHLSVPDEYLDTKTFTLVAERDGHYRLLSPEGDFLANGKVGELLQVDLGAGRSISLLVTRLKAHESARFAVLKKSQLNAIREISQTLSAKETGKNTNIINLELKGKDPIQVTRIVNSIVNAYVQLTVQLASLKAEQKLHFLESQLPIIKDRLDRAEEALNTYRQANRATDLSVETEVLLKQFAEYEKLLVDLKQKREELRPTFGNRNPRVIAINAQINQLEQSLAGINNRVKEIPRAQQQLLRLTRDAEVNKNLYVSLLNSIQELRVAKAGAIGNARIIDYATPPSPNDPIGPRVKLAMSAATAFGLFFGVAVVIFRNSIRRGIGDPEGLERQSGLPVYALVPHSKQQNLLAKRSRRNKQQPAVLAGFKPDDASIESLRGLWVALRRTMLNMQQKALMVCSPGAGIGKSFVSANLAAVMATAGARVIVIDADLRNGKMHDYFGLAREPGLMDMLTASTEDQIGACIQQTSIANLDVVTLGSSISYPSELLLQAGFCRMLDVLSKRYDWIIIDTPPALSAADTAIIGGYADTAIMVVRPETTLQEAEYTTKVLRRAGVGLMGFILNDVEHSTRYQYYRYMRYPVRSVA